MRHGATEAEVRRVIAVIEEMGYKARPMPGAQRTAVGLVGNDGRVDASRLEGLPGVQDVIHVSKPYKQVSREWKSENSVVRLGAGVAVGGSEVVTIAGPCSVESERQIIEAARLVKEAGAVILRGGAWKPRTSPYAFQGLGRPGLKLLAKAREETGLLICDLGHVADPFGIHRFGANEEAGLPAMVTTSVPPTVTPPGSRTTVFSAFHSRLTCLYGLVTWMTSWTPGRPSSREASTRPSLPTSPTAVRCTPGMGRAL